MIGQGGEQRTAPRTLGACCIPGDEHHDAPSTATLETVPSGSGSHPDTLVEIGAGSFRMGDESVWAHPEGHLPSGNVELPITDYLTTWGWVVLITARS
jgi:hypothetical protein